MKSFSTAAKAALHERELPIGPDVSFTYDDREVSAHAPTGPQLAVFLAAFADTASMKASVTDSINFFHSRFEPADASYFKQRLMDPEDPFEFEQVVELLGWLIEEWSARPTQSPSDSAPSRTATGTTSTDTPQDRVLIPSDSGSTDF